MARTYDDAGNHRGTLPGDLPRKAGATHIGMFFAWCAARGLLSDWHAREHPEELARLQRRWISGRDYVLQFMNGALGEEHLNAEGQAFAERYVVSGRYLAEYEAALRGASPSLYHVSDTWETFEQLVPVLDRARSASAEVAPPPREPEPKAEREPESRPQPEPEPEPAQALVQLPSPEPAPVHVADGAHEDIAQASVLDDAAPTTGEEPTDVDPGLDLDAVLTVEEAEVEADEDVVAEVEDDWRRVLLGEGPPEIQSEPLPADELPADEPTEAEAAWNWNPSGDDPHTGSAPPPLPREFPREPIDVHRTLRASAHTSERKGLGGSWIWIGGVIFLLIYGCSKVAARMPHESPNEEWDGGLAPAPVKDTRVRDRLAELDRMRKAAVEREQAKQRARAKRLAQEATPPPPEPLIAVAWADLGREHVTAAAKYGLPVRFENELKMRFVLVPGGVFQMGSPVAEVGRDKGEVQHPVVISKPFSVQSAEVTNAQYRRYGERGYASNVALNS